MAAAEPERDNNNAKRYCGNGPGGTVAGGKDNNENEGGKIMEAYLAHRK
jgi:hypothetical protein